MVQPAQWLIRTWLFRTILYLILCHSHISSVCRLFQLFLIFMWFRAINIFAVFACRCWELLRAAMATGRRWRPPCLWWRQSPDMSMCTLTLNLLRVITWLHVVTSWLCHVINAVHPAVVLFLSPDQLSELASIQTETTVKRAASSSYWKHCSSVSISVSSALEVYLYTTMRYINRRFTYLLTYLLTYYQEIKGSTPSQAQLCTSLVPVIPTCVPLVTEQYKLAVAYWWQCSAAGKVSMGLVESNCSLLPGLYCYDLWADCLVLGT